MYAVKTFMPSSGSRHKIGLSLLGEREYLISPFFEPGREDGRGLDKLDQRLVKHTQEDPPDTPFSLPMFRLDFYADAASRCPARLRGPQPQQRLDLQDGLPQLTAERVGVLGSGQVLLHLEHMPRQV